MKHSFPTLYLFNNVFFPQTVIPVTVSDNNSKDLLLECFDRGLSLAFYHPNQRDKKIATIGKILLLEHNADQSISVLIQGIKRVKLIAQLQHLPIPIFQAEDYFDRAENAIVTDNSIERLHEILSAWFYRHISSKKERDKFLNDISTPSVLINNLCMLLIKDLELKDIFLENTSITERIRLMDALIKGKDPETEDEQMGEAIKNFEKLEMHTHQISHA